MNYPFENDTSAVIKKLARKSVRFDKKKNLFCLSAIIVAVAMIMMSLLTVQNIIYQNQKEIEGLHQGIFFDITQDSKEKLLANEEVKSVGLSCNIKTVKENSKELSLIYYDDDMLSLIPAFDGKYPEKASEIAVTDAFFASENKSPEINAIVQLNLDGTLKNYTIVGIYHDKTSTAYPVFVSLEKCRELRGNNLLNGYVWLENADTLTKELRIDTLAQISYMSRNKLQTCFKDYFGYTIMDYIRIKRLQNAQLLLESTELDVKEIALLCGYRNSSRFSKLFYIQTNMLPRQYRNYIKKGDICDVK